MGAFQDWLVSFRFDTVLADWHRSGPLFDGGIIRQFIGGTKRRAHGGD
jgi:hypothetical protein